MSCFSLKIQFLPCLYVHLFSINKFSSQALEKFMDGFKKSFLEPRTDKNPLEQNVLLVVVLFGGGGDEGEAMRRANKRLLLGYREDWGDDVIQCYEVNHDGAGGKAAFSRGAGLMA